MVFQEMNSGLSPRKLDLVVERQWHIGIHARSLAALGWLGSVYGGFPSDRYVRQGVPADSVKSRPLPAIWNHLADKFPLLRKYTVNEPYSIARWVSTRRDFSPVVACYATAYRYLFPLLQGRGCALLLERGSTHPENYFRQIQKARRNADLPFEETLPEAVEAEINAGKLAHFIGAGSRRIADSYIVRGHDPERILLAPWCTNPDVFSYCDRSERPTSREIRLLCVGVVGLRKGLGRLIGIARWAEKAKLPIRIRLVGPLEPEAPGLLANAPDLVEWAGIKKGAGLVAEFHAADLYILPSYEEGFGISILEALSTGLPAIVSGETGGSEAIRSGENGRILEHFTPDEFETVLLPLLLSAELRLAMARCARKTVMENYTEAHYRTNIAQEYDRMFSIMERQGSALTPSWKSHA